jgi:hypothetical protein
LPQNPWPPLLPGQYSTKYHLSQPNSWVFTFLLLQWNLNKAEICSMWTNSVVPARRISVIYFV